MVGAGGELVVPGFGVVPPFQHLRTEHGLIAWAPFPGGDPLVSAVEWGQPAEGEASLDELRASAARVLGADLPLGPPTGPGPHVMRRLFGGNTRIASQYRADRVLLLGDAAHVHSAIGGPGLNLGLQDAVNLGWKLAAEVHGQAPEGLLDTYESERSPVARRVAMHTQAQSLLIQPGGDVTALRELFGELLAQSSVRQHLADLLAGADMRDLTEEFLSRPWPFPATVLARLTALTGLDAGYKLSYPAHLALREEAASVRVATGVTLHRVPYPTQADSAPEGAIY